MAVVKLVLCLMMACEMLVMVNAVSTIELREHKAELQRLNDMHHDDLYNLDVQYDDRARNLAIETFDEFNTEKCGSKRCFNRVKSANCPDEYRCYAIFFRKYPYATRKLVRNYFENAHGLLKRFFSEHTRFGCAIHVMGDIAEINCVYMKMKNSAIARS